MATVEFNQLLVNNAEFLKPFAITLTRDSEAAKDLFQVKQCFPDTPLVVSGQLARAQSRKTYPGVNFRRSLAEVLDFVTSL